MLYLNSINLRTIRFFVFFLFTTNSILTFGLNPIPTSLADVQAQVKLRQQLNQTTTSGQPLTTSPKAMTPLDAINQMAQPSNPQYFNTGVPQEVLNKKPAAEVVVNAPSSISTATGHTPKAKINKPIGPKSETICTKEGDKCADFEPGTFDDMKSGPPPKTAESSSETPGTPAAPTSEQPPSPQAQEENFTAKFAGGTQFNFPKSREAYKELKKMADKYGVDCSKQSLDKASTAGVSSNFGQADGSSSTLADGGAITATTVGAALPVFESGCETDQEEVQEAGKKLEETIKKEKPECYFAGRTAANNFCVDKINTPAYANCISFNTQLNNQACDKVAYKMEYETNSVLAWMKEHWMVTAGALAALGYGASQLLDSSSTARDENRTVSGTGTNPPNPNGDPANTNQPGHQSCTGNLKPLECYTTSTCNIQCVATNFGIPNYSGQATDFNRIDANGKVVNTDPSTSTLGSTGSGSTASGSTGSTSGSSSGTGSGGGTGASDPGLAPVGGATPITVEEAEAQREIASYSGFDTMGDFGGGGGGFETSTSRNTTESGGKPAAALTATEKFKKAIISGPVSAPTGNSLFESVRAITGRLTVSGAFLGP